MLDLSQPKNVHIDQRLRSEPIIWLSTVRADGRPHIVPVWFFWDGATILIFSEPGKQKLKNLQHNTNVMLALDNTNEGEDVIMLEGTAELLKSLPTNETLAAYSEKYASHLKDMGMDAGTMLKAYSQPIRVTPTRFY